MLCKYNSEAQRAIIKLQSILLRDHKFPRVILGKCHCPTYLLYFCIFISIAIANPIRIETTTTLVQTHTINKLFFSSFLYRNVEIVNIQVVCLLHSIDLYNFINIDIYAKYASVIWIIIAVLVRKSHRMDIVTKYVLRLFFFSSSRIYLII